MKVLRYWLGLLILVALLILAALPFLHLLRASLPLVQLPKVEEFILTDQSTVVGIALPQDHWDLQTQSLRIAQGLVGPQGAKTIVLPQTSLRSRKPATDFWVIEREDGPRVFAKIHTVRIPEGKNVSVDMVLQELPSRLRNDKNRLLEKIRISVAQQKSADPRLFEEWNIWRHRDDQTLVRVQDGQHDTLSIRVSAIRLAWPVAPKTWWQTRQIELQKFWQFLSLAPGSWGGGGILPALLAFGVLALTTGILAGGLGVATAIYLREFVRDHWLARWLSALVAALAGVPGVVWGIVGLGLLVHGLGPWMDKILGIPSADPRWGIGGLLWSSLTLAILAAPVVVVSATQALDRVPAAWRDIARSSGATRWQVVRMVILPEAGVGLRAAIYSGMARALGETTPLMLTGAMRALGGGAVLDPQQWPSLWGGFLHPGVMAIDPPWPVLQLEEGQPMVAAGLLLLAIVCMALEFWARVRLRPKRTRILDQEWWQ